MSNRAWLYPSTAERDYMRQLLAFNKEIQSETLEGMEARILYRTDAWSDDLSALMLELLARFLSPGAFQVARLRDTFTAISQFNDRQWRLQVKAGTGVEIGPSGQLPIGARFGLGSTTNPNSVRAVFGMGVDVYRAEPWLVPLRDNWIADNVRLIKSIPEQSLSQVEGVIRRGVAQGLAPKEIQKQIKEQFGVSERRAKVIARDQVAKANAALTEHRQKDLGVESYTWMSSDDARVRPTHKQTDGETYSWSKPPTITGGHHPGQEIMCRCWARPVFKD